MNYKAWCGVRNKRVEMTREQGELYLILFVCLKGRENNFKLQRRSLNIYNRKLQIFIIAVNFITMACD